MAQSTLRPGAKAPTSGQYKVIGPRGGNHGEITAIKGKILPPTPSPKMGFKLTDRTKHER